MCSRFGSVAASVGAAGIVGWLCCADGSATAVFGSLGKSKELIGRATSRSCGTCNGDADIWGLYYKWVLLLLFILILLILMIF